jgi:hypothetical protein
MYTIEAVSCRSPWKDTDIVTVHHNVATGVLPPRPENMTDKQWMLVVQMSTFQPEDRLDIGAVVPTDEEKRARIIEYIEQNRDQEEHTDPVQSITFGISRPRNVPTILEEGQRTPKPKNSEVRSHLLNAFSFFMRL